MSYSPIIDIVSAARERYSNSSYRWENRERGLDDLWVVQRTLAGRGFHQSAAGETRYAPRGHALIFSHRDGSRYGFPPGDLAPYELEYIALRGPLAASFGTRITREHGPVLTFSGRGEAASLLARLLAGFSQKDFLDTWHASELAYRMLVAIWREQANARREVDPIDYSRIQIETRFDSPTSVKEIAQTVGLSREHLSRAFTKRFGKTPGRLLRELRLQRAQQMLASSRLDIESIGLASGYAGSNSFIRAFKAAFGQSPHAYRASNPNRKKASEGQDAHASHIL